MSERRARRLVLRRDEAEEDSMAQAAGAMVGGMTALTEREREVLELMAAGRSNAGIGASLFISSRTVEQHVEHIFTKLGVRSGTDSNRRVLGVLMALRAGIGG